MSREDDRKKKNKKRDAALEAYIFPLMQKSLKAALDAALDDLFKGWG